MSKPLVTADEVRRLLRYEPQTGDFFWLVDRNNQFVGAGSIAGCNWASGPTRRLYRVIRINGKGYLAHRLAWLYVHGRWPKENIDHIDSDGLNNRLSNLREATRMQNTRNARLKRSNTSGYKGVSFRKDSGKWMASIHANGRKMYLGKYETPEEAHAAYVAAAHKFHGEFARVG
jgi:hypothetical protein